MPNREAHDFKAIKNLEYPLYDSNNVQIAIVKHVIDYEKGDEKFDLNSLEGNLIE